MQLKPQQLSLLYLDPSAISLILHRYVCPQFCCHLKWCEYPSVLWCFLCCSCFLFVQIDRAHRQNRDRSFVILYLLNTLDEPSLGSFACMQNAPPGLEIGVKHQVDTAWEPLCTCLPAHPLSRAHLKHSIRSLPSAISASYLQFGNDPGSFVALW